MSSRILASSLAALALAGAAASAFAAPAWRSMTGIWVPDAPGDTLRTADGQSPPLNAEGRAVFAKTVADRKAGTASDPIALCLPPGTPRVIWQKPPVLLLDTPRKVTMIYEYMHIRRDVHTTDPIPTLDDLNPNWGGTAAARREGDVLVIYTQGFNGETFLDGQGLPASTGLKLTERIRFLPDGKLEDRITVEDPKYYSRPFELRMTYTRAPAGTVMKQENCGEKLLRFPVRNYWAEHEAELKAQASR